MQKLLSAFALIVTISAPTHTALAAVQTAPSFGNFLLNSSASVIQHPQRSMSCFQLYVPKLNQEDENYQCSYGQCMELANVARRDVEMAMQPNRTDVLDAAEAMCSIFENCKYDGNSTDFFQCHSKVASDATKLSYRVVTMSEDTLQYINLINIFIGNNEDACKRAADNNYVDSRWRIFEELHACISGHSPQSQLQSSTRQEMAAAANASTSAAALRH